MPLVYIGRQTLNQGRPLWEILLNLKNFGIGRVIRRNNNAKYPEVSYLRIVKVAPSSIEYPDKMQGEILGETVFRGIKKQELFDYGTIGYKPDFYLVPKHEEEAFINSGAKPKENQVIYPRYMALPPLWQELVRREKAAQGLEPTEDDLRIPLVYNSTSIRIAAEGQKPDFEYWDLIPKRPHLYPHLQKDSSSAESKSTKEHK